MCNGGSFCFHSTPLFKQELNASDLAPQEVNSIPSKPRTTKKSVDRDPSDPEEIHYATITFNTRNPKPVITTEDIQTDYAEIRPYSVKV